MLYEFTYHGGTPPARWKPSLARNRPVGPKVDYARDMKTNPVEVSISSGTPARRAMAVRWIGRSSSRRWQ